MTCQSYTTYIHTGIHKYIYIHILHIYIYHIIQKNSINTHALSQTTTNEFTHILTKHCRTKRASRARPAVRPVRLAWARPTRTRPSALQTLWLFEYSRACCAAALSQRLGARAGAHTQTHTHTHTHRSATTQRSTRALKNKNSC